MSRSALDEKRPSRRPAAAITGATLAAAAALLAGATRAPTRDADHTGATAGPAHGARPAPRRAVPGTRRTYRIRIDAEAELRLAALAPVNGGLQRAVVEERPLHRALSLDGELEELVLAPADGGGAIVWIHAGDERPTHDGGARAIRDGAPAPAIERALREGIVIERAASGAIRRVRLPASTDGEAQAALEHVAELLQVAAPPRPGAASWRATEATVLGEAATEYTRRLDGAIAKRITSVAPPPRAATAPALVPTIDTTLRLTLDDDGAPRTLAGRYDTALAAAPATSPASANVGAAHAALAPASATPGVFQPATSPASATPGASREPAPPAIRTRSTITVEQTARADEPERAARIAATLDPRFGAWRRLGEAAPDADAHAAALAQLTAGRSLPSLIATARTGGPGDALALVAHLQLRPGAEREVAAALADLASDPRGASRVLGALATVDSPAAQAALVEVADGWRAAAPDGAEAIVELLGASRAPTFETEAYLRARRTDPAPAGVTADLALGRVAGAVHPGDPDRAASIVEELASALAEAPPDRVAGLVAALGNTGAPAILPIVAAYLTDPSVLVRRQAVRAVGRIPGAEADRLLAGALAAEADPGQLAFALSVVAGRPVAAAVHAALAARRADALPDYVRTAIAAELART